ncbi:MAG: hypothetical protein K1X94_18935 [Sandaracinaceae bacterium]|nr:hypothetical protein [Sandaracinaceae bacterium]
MREFESPYLAHGTSTTLLLVLTLLGLGLILAALAKMWIHRQAAGLARVAAEGANRLQPGHVVLRGVVATAHGGPAMRVRVEQTGRQRRRKGSTYHTWTESSRDVSVERFELVLEDGTRVAVEPGDDVHLVDALQEERRSGPTTRTMLAELSNGEQAFVEGTLSRKAGGSSAQTRGEGYRDGGYTWTLTRPERGPMLICTESLEGRHERRERFWRNGAIVAIGMFAIAQALAGMLLWPILLHGVSCEAEVSLLDQYVTRGRHGARHHHYVVEADVTRCRGAEELVGAHVSDEIGGWIWESLDEGDLVPFVVMRGDPSVHEFGRESGIRPTTLVMPLSFALFALVAGWGLHRRSLAWYEQKTIVHTGNGPL